MLQSSPPFNFFAFWFSPTTYFAFFLCCMASYDKSSRCAAADPSITFPLHAGSATQDSLTTIQNQVSGVMVWSGGLASVPLSLGASLLGATGRGGR